MILILIGNDYSTLSSFIPQCRDIEISVISRTLDIKYLDKATFEAVSGIVLLDLNNNTSSASLLYKQSRERFPNFKIWAYYTSSSNIIIKNLRSIGYEKVFSSHDNPPESIFLYAVSARNNYAST